MGTRSLTKILDDDGKPFVCIYRQMDGYPTGHGAELKEFLSGFNIVNGLTVNQGDKVANGVHCLAAQIVAHLKDGPGHIYLYPADSDDCGEEYEYRISAIVGGPVTLEVRSIGTNNDTLLYGGSIDEFDPKACELAQ